MRPLRICLENFMSHSFTDIDCTLFKSVLILGKKRNNPLESLGVGKTTLFNGFEYVLFGVVPTKQLDRIVRDNCDRCQVIFEFEISDNIYRIIRSRNKKTGKSDVRFFQKINDWNDISQKTPTETDEEIKKVIKISHIAFQNSIHFAQSDLRGLASVSAKDRKNMLKEPLQISIYSKFEKIAGKQVSDSSKELERLKTLIQSLGDPNSDLINFQLENSKLENQIKLTEIKQNEIQTLLDQYLIKLSDLSKTSKNINAIIIELDLLKNKQKTIINDMNRYKDYIYQSKLEIEKLTNNKIILNESLIKYLDQKEKLESSKLDISIIRNDYNSLYKKEIEGSNLITKLQLEKQKFNQKLPEGDLCACCQQIVSLEHRQAYDIKRKSELIVIEEKLDKYNKILNNIKLKRVQLEKDLQNAQIHEKDILNINHSISLHKLELKQNEDSILSSEEKKSSSEKELENLSEKYQYLIEQKNKLSKIIEENDQIQIEDFNKKIDANKLLRFTVAKELSILNTELGISVEKLKNRENDLSKLNDYKEQLSIIEKQYFMFLKVAQAFSPSGIPTLIINTILDDLQIIVNNLLSSLRPGIELFFSIVKENNDGQQEDTLDINYRINGKDREYTQLSGGQKFLVALSLKLGMSLIIQHRLGVDIKFLELDEVDQSLDVAAIEAFADVIKSWQEKFTIFVITHNETLKNKFTHGILIESDDINGSTGKVVTEW